jgi:membrane protein implicated in regulation of membrane protease activity
VISLIVQLNQLTLPLVGLMVTAVGARLQPQWLFLIVSIIAVAIYVLVRDRIRRDARTARPAEAPLPAVSPYAARNKA